MCSVTAPLSCTITKMKESPVTLTKNTLVPIGVVGTLLIVGTWVGKVEEKLEAHQLQLQSTPHAFEKLGEAYIQTSRDIAQIREALGRIEGAMERERHHR